MYYYFADNSIGKEGYYNGSCEWVSESVATFWAKHLGEQLAFKMAEKNCKELNNEIGVD